MAQLTAYAIPAAPDFAAVLPTAAATPETGLQTYDQYPCCKVDAAVWAALATAVRPFWRFWESDLHELNTQMETQCCAFAGSWPTSGAPEGIGAATRATASAAVASARARAFLKALQIG